MAGRIPFAIDLVLLAMLGLGALLCPPVEARSLLEIWDVDNGQTNRLGGQYNHFMGRGSQASVHLN